jgi:hypothetical protein
MRGFAGCSDEMADRFVGVAGTVLFGPVQGERQQALAVSDRVDPLYFPVGAPGP